LDAALTLICKRREDSFFVNNEGGGSPSQSDAIFGEQHEVDNLDLNSPRRRENGSSSSSGGSGQGADENQPRHANMDRMEAMRFAAQLAAIREQVANEMEIACKSMSMQRIPSMNTVMTAGMSRSRDSSPFAGPRTPLVQQQPLPFSRSASIASGNSFNTQSMENLRVPSSDSFRSISSFRSASAIRSGVQSPRPARPSSGASSSQPQRQVPGLGRRPHESPRRASGPGYRFAEADGFRASTPQRQDSFRASTPQRQDNSVRSAGTRLATAPCSSGQLQSRSSLVLSGKGLRPGPGRAFESRSSRLALSTGSPLQPGCSEQAEREDDAAIMKKRLNVAAEIINGLVFDSNVLEEAKRSSELGRQADALSARPSPEKPTRRSRSCNVFWRPPPEAARVCETARGASLSRAESLDGSCGSAVHRASSENSRPLAQVLGMGCGGLVREDSWGAPAAALSFGPMQGRCGATSTKAAPWQAQSMSRAPGMPPGATARPTQSRKSVMLSPRGLTAV